MQYSGGKARQAKRIAEILDTLDLSEDTYYQGESNIWDDVKTGESQVDRLFASQTLLQRRCCVEDDDFPVFTDEGRKLVEDKTLELFSKHGIKVRVCVDEQEKGYFTVYVRQVN